MTSVKNEFLNEAMWGSTIITGSYFVVLIDKSDTTNFYHGSTTSLRVSGVSLEGLFGTNFSGDIHIGQMTTTAPGTQVTGVFNTWRKWTYRITAGPKSVGGNFGQQNQTFEGDLEADYSLRCSNLTATGSHFPNDRPLPTITAAGSTRVGTGDICLWIKHTTGTLIDFNIRLKYYSH
jgi:hypothetical protein